MAYGIQAWNNTHEVVNIARPFNHIHSMRIINQGGGTFSYNIPGYDGEGTLTMTFGKVTSNETIHNQGGNGRYCISDYSIVNGTLTLTMAVIPDPNTISDPLHINFFLGRL